jgi:hypothetical protein
VVRAHLPDGALLRPRAGLRVPAAGPRAGPHPVVQCVRLGVLLAFIFLLGRTYAARTFTHEQQVSAIVVSYYWHFVDVVWIGLFTVIYLIH